MLRAVVVLFVWFSILTGIIYPLAITGIAQLIMPEKANGSLITIKGKVVGSHLIGQRFTSDNYFWPRPSAVAYSTLPSSGSNLGPTSPALIELVQERRKGLQSTQELSGMASIPADLLLSSASGLDPHISYKSTLFQLNRVAKARKMNHKQTIALEKLIQDRAEGSWFEGFERTYVNVLDLNLALDKLTEETEHER